MSKNDYKIQAAAHALEMVRPGMRLGLGSGSTAAAFVNLLGKRVAEGLDIIAVPTSEETHRQALALNIPLTTLDDQPFLDMTVDGADEIDPLLRLVKGGGGAHLREKIVAMASDQLVIVADSSKLVETLGRFKLPVEIVQFGLGATRAMVHAMVEEAQCNGEIELRTNADGSPFITDSGNLILDCDLGHIPDAELLAEALKIIPGVVEHGLFLGLADVAIVAGENGVTTLYPPTHDGA